MIWVAESHAGFTNRYPKLDDFGHQIYLEQHELPAFANGPTDPAPSPDGKSIALAAQGWLWLLDIDTRIATRITDSAAIDSRPRWSPDNKHLAFVRDDGQDTAVLVLEIESGKTTVINSPGIDLDPEFSADGEYLYYSSGASGSLSVWRRHLASGAEQQLTDLHQVERNIRRLPEGDSILYLHGSRAYRSLRLRDFISGEDSVVHQETLTYHLSSDIHPKLRLAVYSAPINGDYHLWTIDLDDPRARHRLTDGTRYALTPAFSADGNSIYFVEADAQRQFVLKKINTYGGASENVNVNEWRYGVATGTGTVKVSTKDGQALAARLSITDAAGHPVPSSDDATYTDPITGRSYFYSDGESALTLPVGRYTVTAARGPMTAIVTQSMVIKKDKTAELTIELEPLWDAKAAGYVSADYHNHLNGDGTSRANHQQTLRIIKGEDLDHVAPMTWNRWERRVDGEILGLQSEDSGHVVDQGQEVRSHFHGHIGLNGVDVAYAPWFFGPNNPTLGNPDLTNGDVIAYAKSVGALPTYVHPGSGDADPFIDVGALMFPLEFPSDAILEDGVGLEIVTGWDDGTGAAQLWYRLLNIGKNVPAMSGTDAWVDFYRTPAVGTARSYVRTEGTDQSYDSILSTAFAGQGFVTTGPALIFTLGDGSRPGGLTSSGEQSWSLMLASVVAIDTVEIIVNGQVAQTLAGLDAGEKTTLRGKLNLPGGGWVAARAYSKVPLEDPWPIMHKTPFAHSAPIWIDHIGSTESAAQKAAASDLLRALDAVEQEFKQAYGDQPMERLMARIERARNALSEMLN
ncbi:MAG: CehA/McbA family metallohydrolase [Congregibacter sp.]|nr:CehA/McbA family metallohydrolase [Congregibacter sp.]